MAEGTRITCEDIRTGESDSAVIRNDFMLVTDGRCYLDGTQIYGNGTVVLTIKKKAASDE